MTKTLRRVPSPKGLKHLRVMERAATYTNLAVWQLYQDYGEVFSFGFGPIKFTWLIGEEANRFILQEQADKFRMAYDFLKPIGGRYALINSEDPEHLRMRRMLQPAFHNRSLTAMSLTIVQELEHYLNTWQVGEIRNVHQEVRQLILQIICKLLLGQGSLERYPDLLKKMTVLMDFANLPFLAQQLKLSFPGTPWQRFLKARAHLDQFIYADIKRRRLAPGSETDLLEMLLQARYEDGTALSDLELRDQLVSLVSAGFDTTSAALSWCLYHLLEHPERLLLLEQDLARLEVPVKLKQLLRLDYLDACVKESLRLYPPAPAGLRRTLDSVIFKGFLIPKDTLVAFSIYTTQRTGYYQNPLEFRPERWFSEKPSPFAYLPFGYGARYCLGSSWATLMIKLCPVRIIQRFELAGAYALPVLDRGNTVQPKGGLPVVVKKIKKPTLTQRVFQHLG